MMRVCVLACLLLGCAVAASSLQSHVESPRTFHGLDGLKPRLHDPISRKVSHKFSHRHTNGRQTHLEYTATIHKDLVLLDGHDRVDRVECTADHMTVFAKGSAANDASRSDLPWATFPNEIDPHRAELQRFRYLTGGLHHGCKDKEQGHDTHLLRRVVSAVEEKTNQWRLGTEEAQIHDILEHAEALFRTNNFTHSDIDYTHYTDEIEEGDYENQPLEEFVNKFDKAKGLDKFHYQSHVFPRTHPKSDDSAAAQQSRRLLAADESEQQFLIDDEDIELQHWHHHHHHHHWLRHLRHAIHKGFHHLSHSLHRFTHKVGHFFHHLSRTVQKIAKGVWSGVKLIGGQLLGKTYQKHLDEHKTFGWNYNTHTHGAKKPLYIGKSSQHPISCNNCFMEADVDIEMALKLQHFKVKQAYASIKAHEQISMDGSWSYNKKWTETFGPKRVLDMKIASVHFFIGPVPVNMQFQLGVNFGFEVDVDVAISTRASVHDTRTFTVGIAHGELPTSWNSNKVRGSGLKTYVDYSSQGSNGAVSGDVDIKIGVGMDVTPTLYLNIDKFVYAEAEIKPAVKLQIELDEHATAGYYTSHNHQKGYANYGGFVDVSLKDQIEVGLYGGIPMLKLGYGTKASPKIVYNSGWHTIYHKRWTNKGGSQPGGRRLLDAPDTTDPETQDIQKWLGCFRQSTADPLFKSFFNQSAQLTVSDCVETCRDFGFVHAAMSSGDECLCDAIENIEQSPRKVSDGSCDTPCAGKLDETCGGEGFVSAFQTMQLKPGTGDADSVQPTLAELNAKVHESFPGDIPEGDEVDMANCATDDLMSCSGFGACFQSEAWQDNTTTSTPAETVTECRCHPGRQGKACEEMTPTDEKYQCPIGGCTLAHDLEFCGHLNGEPVCADPMRLRESDEEVGRLVKSLAEHGPVCQQHLISMHCEMAFPRCAEEDGADNLVKKLCYGNCLQSHGVCGANATEAMRACDSASSASYSQIAPPSADTCSEPLLAAVIDAVPQFQCSVVPAAELKTCGDVVGKSRSVFINPDLNGDAAQVDAQVKDILDKIARDATNPFHKCAESARLLTCTRHFPECHSAVSNETRIEDQDTKTFKGMDAGVCLSLASSCSALTAEEAQSMCTSQDRADVIAHIAPMGSDPTVAGYTDLAQMSFIADATITVGQRTYMSKQAADSAVENTKKPVMLESGAFAGIIIASVLGGIAVTLIATKAASTIQKRKSGSAGSSASPKMSAKEAKLDLTFEASVEQ